MTTVANPSTDSNLISITTMHALCFATLLLWIPGCDDFNVTPRKALPAPLANHFPYEIPAAQRMAIWGGDNFEVSDAGVVHFIVLQAADSPKPGQAFYRRSRKRIVKLVTGQPLRIVVHGLDEQKREIARVYVDGLDVSYELVRSGLAWYDGTEFEDANKFRNAEQTAREKKRGLWQQDNPVHPSSDPSHEPD